MKSVLTRFSAAAQTYDQSAAVQAEVALHLLDYIPRNARPVRILEVGCGTGLLTAGLRRRFPHSRLDAVDLSPAMIARARQKLADNSINWMAGNIQNLPVNSGYNLLVSSSSLHWFQPLPEGVGALRRHMTDDGRIVCAVMLEGTLRELHVLRRRLFPRKPTGASLPTPGEVQSAFAVNRLKITDMETVETAFIHASAGEFLRSLHEQGVTGGLFSRNHAPLVRGELRRLTAAYDSQFAHAGGVHATYKVLYLSAEPI